MKFILYFALLIIAAMIMPDVVGFVLTLVFSPLGFIIALFYGVKYILKQKNIKIFKK